ncbi:hypothetical protein LWI28_022748 [Acer negundo]|uniref:Uncharacterized protein n=1 Tax=Acer negundo TaxID=4023 RepID=A0AAD5IJ91_ACENE|nr:hypothetical protein LWI28_022748 [Acer negundo]KAK4843870.1 hypothetical protein QYF36_013711 [Acer negundo]
MLNNSESPGRIELPLAFNTPGWVKGIGYDILVDISRYIMPSNVVKINISFEKKNLPAGAFWLDGDGDKFLQYCMIMINFIIELLIYLFSGKSMELDTSS